jgi:hypothetical protein
MVGGGGVRLKTLLHTLWIIIELQNTQNLTNTLEGSLQQAGRNDDVYNRHADSKSHDTLHNLFVQGLRPVELWSGQVERLPQTARAVRWEEICKKQNLKVKLKKAKNAVCYR